MTGKKSEESIMSHLKKHMVQAGIAILAATMFIAGTYSYQFLAQRISESEWDLPVLKTATETDIRINQLLSDLLHDTHSQRAYIFKFHNGGHLVGGIPFRKTSISHEVVKPGVSRELGNCKDIPLSAVPDAMELIVQKSGTFEIETKNLNDGFFKAMIQRQAIHFMVWRRLLNDGRPIGFIGIDYLMPRKELVELMLEEHLIEPEMTNNPPGSCTYPIRCKVETIGSLIEFELTH